VAVAVPVQVLVKPLGVATTMFVGKVSVKLTPRMITGLGLVIVIVRVETPFTKILDGVNDFWAVGG
jgi:hypothetical protein